MRLEQFRRSCRHNCSDKQLCRHECCKAGVGQADRGRRALGGDGDTRMGKFTFKNKDSHNSTIPDFFVRD